MRKLAKILALLLVLALCVVGIVLTVSAEEETETTVTERTLASDLGILLPNDATLTLDEGIAQALKDRGYVALLFNSEAQFKEAMNDVEALAAKGMTTFTHPTGESMVYVYLLTDVKTDYTGKASVYFNLGGNKISYSTTQKAAASYNNIAYFNGTFEDARTVKWDHGFIRGNDGKNRVAFLNATVYMSDQTFANYGQNAFFRLYAEDVTFKKTTTISSFNSALLVVEGKDGYISPFDIILKDVTTESTIVKVASGSASVADSFKIHIFGDCDINGLVNDTRSGDKSVHVAANVATGTRLTANSKATFEGAATTDLVLEDGQAIIPNDDAKYAYIVGVPDATINWYDENDHLLGSTYGSVGEVPSYSYTPATGGFQIESDKVYLMGFAGWATSADGEAADLTAVEEGETERNYYCVVEKTEAAVAVFSDSTCTTAINAWADASLTKAQWDALPAGAYVKFYTDIVADPADTSENSFYYGQGDITIDLGGYTLAIVNTSSTNKRFRPNGHTLTFKDGDIAYVARAGLTLFNASAVGDKFVFENVDITGSNTTAPLFDIRYGAVEIYGGSIDYTCGIAFNLQAQHGSETTASVNASLYGVRIKTGGNSLMSVSGVNVVTVAGPVVTEKISKVNVVIGDYEGKASRVTCGSFIRFDTVNNQSSQSTYNFSVYNSFVESSIEADMFTTTSRWFTWFDADAKAFEDNDALEKSNVNIIFNNVYTNREVPALDNVNVATGISQEIVENDDFSYLYGATPKADAINANLTLYSDFNLNLFIPKNANITAIIYNGDVIFSVADEIYAEYDADTYKVTIPGITPNTAAKYINLQILYTESATVPDAEAPVAFTFSANAKYSVIKYAADLIAIEDAVATNAMKALLGYIDAAYDNFEGDESDEAVVALLDTLIVENGVAEFLEDFLPLADETDKDFEDDEAFAVFQIGTVTKLHITFSEGAVWTVEGTNVSRSGNGGVCEINLPAYALNDLLTITVDGAEATFSFAEYAEYLMYDDIDNETEDAVLVAMYAYGETARALNAQVNA